MVCRLLWNSVTLFLHLSSRLRTVSSSRVPAVGTFEFILFLNFSMLEVACRATVMSPSLRLSDLRKSIGTSIVRCSSRAMTSASVSLLYSSIMET